MSLKSFEYCVKGTVQGWGQLQTNLLNSHRSWTVKQASSIGITGYVKNENSGDVTGVAEGDADSLAKFAKLLEKGPSASDVADVQISNEKEVSKQKYSSFDQQ